MSDINEVSAKTKVVDVAEVKDEAGNITTPGTTKEVTRTVQYSIPGTLDGMIAQFGNDVVASQAQAALVISLQAFVRRHADKSQEELQKLVSAWKPETRAAVNRKTKEEKVEELVGSLSAEERKALIAKLKAA